MNKKYERYWTLGWEAAGPFLLGVRRQAINCGCELAQEPIFLRLASTNTIKLTATGGNIDGFIEYMTEQEKHQKE